MSLHSSLFAISASTVNHGLTAALWWFAVIWLACLGGCVGSFLNVVWDRLGSETGIVFPRSRCPECDHELRWYHNIPILGWIMLRGRCYDCGSRIGVKHLIIEAIFAATFAAVGVALLPIK
jgi:prepilin signal peptidase PulO-like enzyme (type II secretory pathway)